MISLFGRDFSLGWHARVLGAVAGLLLLAFSLAVNLVFRVELR